MWRTERRWIHTLLDILVMPNEEGSLTSTVYRKPTHTDLNLHWDSHHTLPSKYSVIGTLHYRAKTICSNPQLLKQEEDHLNRTLTRCKYLYGLSTELQLNQEVELKRKAATTKNTETDNIQKPHIFVPYHRGLNESFKKVCSNHGV